MAYIDASKDQSPEGFSGLFAYLGMVIVENLGGDRKDIRMLKPLEEGSKESAFHDHVIIQQDYNFIFGALHSNVIGPTKPIIPVEFDNANIGVMGANVVLSAICAAVVHQDDFMASPIIFHR